MVSEAQIDALADGRGCAELDGQERAVLALCKEVTRGPGASAQTRVALRAVGFDDDEALVERVLTASFNVFVGRVLRSLTSRTNPVARMGGAGSSPKASLGCETTSELVPVVKLLEGEERCACHRSCARGIRRCKRHRQVEPHPNLLAQRRVDALRVDQQSPLLLVVVV